MKLYFSTVLIFFSIFIFSQEGITFETTTFQEALAKAKKEKKLVFLDAFASWCGPCKMLERNIFSQKSVGNFYNKNFVNTHVDMELGEGLALAKKYSIRSYPTLLILNSDGEVVQKTVGYQSENQFLSFGKGANDPKNKLGSPKERFEKGEKDLGFLENLIQLNANSDFDLAKKAAERYFTVKKDKKLSEQEVSYLFYFTRSISDPNYDYLTKNKAEVVKVVEEKVYTEFMNQIKIAEISQQSLNQATGKIDEVTFLQKAIPLVGEEEANKIITRLKLSFYPAVENYAEFEKVALIAYKNYEEVDTKELEKAAFIFSEKVTNPASLKQALVWMESVVMKGETAQNTFVLAKLHQKLGQKEQALMFAEYANVLAKKENMDSTVSEKLIEELKSK